MRTLVLTAAAVMTLAAAAPARADHRGKIDWKTPEDGFAAARTSRKPIILFFTASW
jgi:hypothetical protein